MLDDDLFIGREVSILRLREEDRFPWCLLDHAMSFYNAGRRSVPPGSGTN